MALEKCKMSFENYTTPVYLPHIESYRKLFKYICGKIWNDLPNNIQNTPSVEAFKYANKKFNFKHKNTH